MNRNGVAREGQRKSPQSLAGFFDRVKRN